MPPTGRKNMTRTPMIIADPGGSSASGQRTVKAPSRYRASSPARSPARAREVRERSQSPQERSPGSRARRATPSTGTSSRRRSTWARRTRPAPARPCTPASRMSRCTPNRDPRSCTGKTSQSPWACSPSPPTDPRAGWAAGRSGRARSTTAGSSQIPRRRRSRRLRSAFPPST